MRTYTLSNGLKMLECDPLNWRIEKTYAVDIPDNPEVYVIDIGSIGEMWQCLFNPKTMIVSFCNMAYSRDEVYRFKVESIEEASAMALKFAKGMGIADCFQGTIYEK